MSVPVLAFFNNKGGVGKTALVYHLAWMYSEIGLHVTAVDLDPQSNLTSAFLEEDRLERLWSPGASAGTVFHALRPLATGEGDVAAPHVERVDAVAIHTGRELRLILGDLQLSAFEDELATAWPQALSGNPRSFRVMSAFWRLMQSAARSGERTSDLILVDLGPNLGAINRAALISCDHVVVPLSPDLFSLQTLRNLGPVLRRWPEEWRKRLDARPSGLDFDLPSGRVKPVGYVVVQHSVRLDHPVRSSAKWIARIPEVYRTAVLDRPVADGPSLGEDPECLALLKHYRSLMPMAQEARKPMFFLKPADGAIGAHAQAVQAAYADFQSLARKIAGRIGVEVPSSFA